MADSKGTVSRFDDSLFVSFKYSKFRFEAVRRLSGVRYDKEQKVWVVPLQHLLTLEKSRLFKPGEMSYLFDIEPALDDAKRIKSQKKEARTRIKLNPYSVPQGVIDQAEVDVVISLAKGQSALGVSLRERGRSIVEKTVCAKKTDSQHELSLPTPLLRELLLALKKNLVSFAVEEHTAEVLQQGIKIRDAIYHGASASLEELRAGLLSPVVVPAIGDKQSTFAIVDANDEQLKSLLPKVRGKELRYQQASELDKGQLLHLLTSALNRPFKLWLSVDALKLLRSEQDNAVRSLHQEISLVDESLDFPVFQEKHLALYQPTTFWHVDLSGAGGLCWSKAALNHHWQNGEYLFLKHHRATTNIAFPTHYWYRCPNSSLLTFFKEVASVANFPCSDRFATLYKDLLQRSRFLERQKYFQSLTDCDPECSNQSLVKKLFPHQRVALRWLKECSEAFLGDDMGLGKTLSVLAAFDALKTAGELDFLLVVCPNSLTRNWIQEARNWVPQLNLTLMPSKREERETFLKSSSFFLHGIVINYELLRLDYIHPLLGELLRQKNGLLVLDESQRSKNSQSRTFAALSSLAPLAKRRILMSGTPTPRDLADIWSQMYLLDGGSRLGTDYYRWLEQVAELGNKWSDYAVISYREEESRESIVRVHELLLRRKKEDVVSLPEKLFSTRYVEMQSEQFRRYEEVRKELLCTVSSQEGDTFQREISSILEEYLRAVQVASNPRLIDPQWKGEPAKFLELDDIVEELVKENDRSLIIWTNYLLNVSELTSRYAQLGVAPFSGEVSPTKRAETVKDFQDRKLRILVAVPAAGGVGITLTAAQTAVYLEKTWNGEHWMQSIDRLHRIGQKGTVNIISLHACKVDQLISSNLDRKLRLQRDILDNNASLSFLPTREELLSALQK